MPTNGAGIFSSSQIKNPLQRQKAWSHLCPYREAWHFRRRLILRICERNFFSYYMQRPWGLKCNVCRENFPFKPRNIKKERKHCPCEILSGRCKGVPIQNCTNVLDMLTVTDTTANTIITITSILSNYVFFCCFKAVSNTIFSYHKEAFRSTKKSANSCWQIICCLL